MKTKKIITLLSGVLIGLSIGMLINKNDKEKIEVNSRNVDSEYTVLRVYDNDDYCNICGEKLEENEKESGLCVFCSEYYEGYKKGVNDTLKKYDIIKGDL